MRHFPNASIQHLSHFVSDHYPLLISLNLSKTARPQRLFKFEVWWTIEESFEEKVKQLWQIGNGDVLSRLNSLCSDLIEWADSIWHRRHKEKRRLGLQFERLLHGERDYANLMSLIDTKIQLNWEIEKDEVYWEQWARANWLKLSDKNRSFSHRHAS